MNYFTSMKRTLVGLTATAVLAIGGCPYDKPNSAPEIIITEGLPHFDEESRTYFQTVSSKDVLDGKVGLSGDIIDRDGDQIFTSWYVAQNDHKLFVHSEGLSAESGKWFKIELNAHGEEIVPGIYRLKLGAMDTYGNETSLEIVYDIFDSSSLEPKEGLDDIVGDGTKDPVDSPEEPPTPSPDMEPNGTGDEGIPKALEDLVGNACSELERPEGIRVTVYSADSNGNFEQVDSSPVDQQNPDDPRRFLNFDVGSGRHVLVAGADWGEDFETSVLSGPNIEAVDTMDSGCSYVFVFDATENAEGDSPGTIRLEDASRIYDRRFAKPFNLEVSIN